MDWLNLINRYWPHLAAGFDFLAALLASAMPCCTSVIPAPQRFGSGVIWLMRDLDRILYLVFGVNRIRRRAISLQLNKTAPTGHHYRDLAHLPLAERACQNFDHPSLIESPLLVAQLAALARGEPSSAPS